MACLKSFTEMAGNGETSISFWLFGVPGRNHCRSNFSRLKTSSSLQLFPTPHTWQFPPVPCLFTSEHLNHTSNCFFNSLVLSSFASHSIHFPFHRTYNPGSHRGTLPSSELAPPQLLGALTRLGAHHSADGPAQHAAQHGAPRGGGAFGLLLFEPFWATETGRQENHGNNRNLDLEV